MTDLWWPRHRRKIHLSDVSSTGDTVYCTYAWNAFFSCYTYCCNVTRSIFYENNSRFSVLNSQGLGFEAFFTYECVLVVAVSNKKEYVALSLTDHGLHDCKWHCITIVHAPARRPFGSSTLSLYLDGRLVHATSMKLPPLSDPFTFLRIGAAPVRVAKPSATAAQRNFNYPDTLPILPMSHRLPAHELITVQQGSQDHIFGIPVSLKGQLNSVCIFVDTVLPSEAKELFDGGKTLQLLEWKTLRHQYLIQRWVTYLHRVLLQDRI